MAITKDVMPPEVLRWDPNEQHGDVPQSMIDLYVEGIMDAEARRPARMPYRLGHPHTVAYLSGYESGSELITANAKESKP